MTTYSIERTAGPVHEPVTKEVVKRQCRVEVAETVFDEWLDGTGTEKGVIASAREFVENDINQVLMPQTFILKASDWLELSGGIDLQRHPVQAVSAINYFDSSGNPQVVDEDFFEVVREKFRSRLYLASNTTTLPTLAASRPWPLSFTLLAGYSLATVDVETQRAAVPRAAVMAVLLLLGHWFRNRESVAVGTISSEIEQSYRALVRSLKQERYR